MYFVKNISREDSSSSLYRIRPLPDTRFSIISRNNESNESLGASKVDGSRECALP